MKIARIWAMPALCVVLALVPAVTRAQTPSLSDFLAEILTDRNSNPVSGGVSFVIPEGVEGPVTFNIPALNIDFLEVTGARSDRFHLDPFTVTVTSDTDPGGLARRPNAILIPAAANETFFPVVFFADSDGNTPGITQPGSDRFRLFVGAFAGNTGMPVFDVTLSEPPDETTAERLGFTLIIPSGFDVEEPLSETGGVSGIISDHIDLSPVSGFFLSSDNPSDYANLPPADGTLVEDPVNGNGLNYGLGFISDVVPEPGPMVSVLSSMVAAGWLVFGRSLRKRRR